MGRFGIYPSLRNRVAVVTGGASGIGEGIVEAFAQQGTLVAFLDVAAEAGEALVARLGQGVRFYACDLTDVTALRTTTALVLKEFGGVDVLVNNAGNDTRHAVEEVTPESWDRTMAVNLKQQFFMCQSVLPAMKAKGAGSIINMSSIAWVIPSTGLPVYVAAKAAIVGMTRTLAHEVGPHGIRVNCVLPGAIATERQRRLWLTPEYEAEVLSRQAIKRLIEPDEVARMVLFLAAEDSAGITNQSFVVDGGWV
jgi:NAD(P)-dependent dehydrogenase (short-subunit alcohol dehydrogenase family)